MASKSNINVVIDNGSGITIEVQDDASGYLVITMSDGKAPLAMKLGAQDSHVLRNCLMYSDALRQQIPQS